MQIHRWYSLMLRVNKLQKIIQPLKNMEKLKNGTECKSVIQSRIPFCIQTHPGQYLVSYCVYTLTISVTVYLYSVLRLHNCVHLYAEQRSLRFPYTNFMYIGNNLASLELSEWLLGIEFHALKLLETTCFVYQPISLPLQDSSPEHIHQCLNHPLLKSLKQCLLWEFTAQPISARQCLFIPILHLLSQSPSCLYPSQASATPVQERVQEVITERVRVGINMYDSTSMELLAISKL